MQKSYISYPVMININISAGKYVNVGIKGVSKLYKDLISGQVLPTLSKENFKFQNYE